MKRLVRLACLMLGLSCAATAGVSPPTKVTFESGGLTLVGSIYSRVRALTTSPSANVSASSTDQSSAPLTTLKK